MTMLTITILTLICATTLIICTQNTAAGMQTAGWQEALLGAESGIEVAVRALNQNSWTNWRTVSAALPTPAPGASPVAGYTYEPTTGTGSAAAGAPTSSQYNYLPSARLILPSPTPFPNSEGPATVSTWVTVDTGGMPSGWYRIRATGETSFLASSGNSSIIARRISNNRLDGDLRNTISTRLYANSGGQLVNRRGGNFIGAMRMVEAIVHKPFGWGGITLQHDLDMSGGGIIDYFNSNTTPTATFLAAQTGSNPPANPYRGTDYSKQLVGELNANGSDLKNTYIYGGLSYSTSGSAPQNTSHVQGPIATGYSASIPTVSDPSFSTGYLTYSGGSPPFNSTSGFTSSKIKINGNLTVPGGQSLHIAAGTDALGHPITHYDIWITGDYTTSGSGYITQDAGVTTTWYVDGNMTTSGGSFINNSGKASDVSFIGVNPTNANNATFTISGSGSFVGTIMAPSYSGTISGSGSVVGAVWGNALNISGGASLHYDAALDVGNGNTYTYVSYFEDNSDPIRKDVNLHPIVY